MSALAVLDSHDLLHELLKRARKWPTAELRAECLRGIAASGQSDYWPTTLHAIGLVLRERQQAEITQNDGESQ